MCWGSKNRPRTEQEIQLPLPSSSFGRKGVLSAPGIQTFLFLEQAGHAVSEAPSSCRVRTSKEVCKTIPGQDTGACRPQNLPDAPGVRPVTGHPSTCQQRGHGLVKQKVILGTGQGQRKQNTAPVYPGTLQCCPGHSCEGSGSTSKPHSAAWEPGSFAGNKIFLPGRFSELSQMLTDMFCQKHF